jgi:hypothetical protein
MPFVFTNRNGGMRWGEQTIVNTNDGIVLTGILDSLTSTTKTNAIGIYAFKLCFATYNGPVVNIRRASDNTTSDFYSNSTGTIGTNIYGRGISLSSWLTSTTGYVTKWYDQSGKGNHMTQTTAASQPQIIINDPDGICVYLTTVVSGGQLTTPLTGVWPASSTTSYHIHDVSKVITIPSGGNELISLIGGNPPRIHHPWSDGQIYFDSPDRINTSTAITTNKKIKYNFCKSAATGKLTLVADGTVYQGAISTASTTVSGISLNTQFGGSNHYMYEISVYNIDLYGKSDQTLLDASF